MPPRTARAQKVKSRLIGFATVLLVFPPAAFTCSAFLISGRNGNLLGRNLDWTIGSGFLVVNQRGLKKKALVGPPSKPALWTSRYGSVTFNQVGRELPYGGINEKGLDVEQLWLRSARFPGPNDQPTVNELQWIQYQLDRFSTVREVLANLKRINVTSRIAPIHYLVCEASGACATIELIAGKFVVHRGKSLPIRALTNDAYSESIAYARKFGALKDASGLPPGTKSLARFARLSFLLSNKNDSAEVSPDEAFAGLSEVSSARSDEDDDQTQWSIVKDLKRRIVYFTTLRSPARKYIDLSRIDFSCGKPAQVLDVDVQGDGDVSGKFTDYTAKFNLDFVGKSLSTGFAHLPPETIRKVAEYPDSAVCERTDKKVPDSSR